MLNIKNLFSRKESGQQKSRFNFLDGLLHKNISLPRPGEKFSNKHYERIENKNPSRPKGRGIFNVMNSNKINDIGLTNPIISREGEFLTIKKAQSSRGNFFAGIGSLFKKKPAQPELSSSIQSPTEKSTPIPQQEKKPGLMQKISGLFKKKEKSINQPEKRIEFFKKKLSKEKQNQQKALERRQRIKDYLERAGLDISPQKLSKTFFNTAVFINLAISAYLIYYFSVNYGITWGTVVASMIVLWILVFILLIFALWILFYFAVDLKIFKRKIDIEDVLPDFLQLTASNINAGMTIDRALWFAVRPRFGVLAKEIEMIAKETMSGADLKEALEKFASRYDSVILKRSVSMINEGIAAGGKIGELLNRISMDIQEQKAMLREMAANVTTYVIFISFASIVAAPFLFSLSGVLIQVVQSLGSSLGSAVNAASTSGIPITFSGSGITQSDFRIFAVVSLSMTAFFSAIMITIIKKGNVKSGIKYIPIFIAISLVLYFTSQTFAGKLLSVFFK